MSTSFCTICGAVLRNGVCPNGHPQRAALRARTRRRRRWPWVLAFLVLLIAVTAYGGLRWYPMRAAGELVGPTSVEFAAALEAYREAVEAAPVEGDDPQAVIEAAAAVVEPAQAARIQLTQAQLKLEGRTAPEIPVISDQPPLSDAIELRERMLRLYPVALETVADLESLAGYITELSRTLPPLQNIESMLRKAGAAELSEAVAEATPVAGQLSADLEAITPPDELGAVHASLQAIAAQITGDLEQAGETGGQASEPILRALVKDIIGEVRDFRQMVAASPATALESGLQAGLRAVDRLAARIEEGLRTLQDEGVTGLTIPAEPLG
jgi:hypothetical protein